MPRYEFSEGAHHKFWEITLKDTEVVTHYGRIGAAGQSTSKSFKNAAEARSAYDALIKEKTKKGYALVSGGGSAAPAAPESKSAPAGKAPAPTSSDALAAKLARIDELLKEANPEAFASLKPAASDAALKPLADAFSGGALPPDLMAFFRWHDGQSEIESLSQDSNRTPMSAAEALDAWQSLTDPKADLEQPFTKSWLPIFTNGAGDYLVYESAGQEAGALIGYWHGDDDRNVEYESLLAWATELEKEQTPEKKKAAKAAKGGKVKFNLDLSATAWKKAKSPDQAALAAKPVGTAYQYRRRYFAQQQPFYCVYVKVAPNVWYYAMARAGIAEAYAEIIKTANKSQPPRDYEWKKDDRYMAIEQLDTATVNHDLKDFQTQQEKWATDHVGLFEGIIAVTQRGK